MAAQREEPADVSALEERPATSTDRTAATAVACGGGCQQRKYRRYQSLPPQKRGGSTRDDLWSSGTDQDRKECNHGGVLNRSAKSCTNFLIPPEKPSCRRSDTPKRKVSPDRNSDAAISTTESSAS